MTSFEFRPDGTVDAQALPLSTESLYRLEDNLVLFFTGYSRDADSILEDQRVRSERKDDAMLENLHKIASIGRSVGDALESGDTRRFGELMHEHWLNKAKRSSGISNDRIDQWYELGRKNGAVGGKLVGAGGGGFLLFYARDRLALREAMAREGLEEVRFTFDHDGSQLIARN